MARNGQIKNAICFLKKYQNLKMMQRVMSFLKIDREKDLKRCKNKEVEKIEWKLDKRCCKRIRLSFRKKTNREEEWIPKKRKVNEKINQ